MKLIVIFAAAAAAPSALAFVVNHASSSGISLSNTSTRLTTPPPRRIAVQSAALFSTKLPSMEQLSSDSFMNQVNYASEIVPLLEQETDENLLTDMISAQLSHSNGIRGFFVSYLTGGDVSVADDENMPQPLRTAIAQNLNANKKELISLSCMNVIMPTGMITMHTDEEMSKNSAKTAARGKIVARAMMEEDEMKEQCLAILAVATDKTHGCDEKRVKYWTAFFEKWGYGTKQKEDIAAAFKTLLSA
jgi:hypothetical protein